MVKHIILWNLKEEYSEAEKTDIKKSIKENLEGLKGQIPGLLNISVQTECFSSSTADLMLESEFESFDSLKAYAVHPKHVEVADKYVRPHTALRSCLDFEA